jgi:hypothetical protein
MEATGPGKWRKNDYVQATRKTTKAHARLRSEEHINAEMLGE